MKKLQLLTAILIFFLPVLALGNVGPVPLTAQDIQGYNALRDVIIPLANMGIGAIIAILLIWQIFPILNRNTETLKEIAATLDVISNNNLRLAEKLLDIIEKQSLSSKR